MKFMLLLHKTSLKSVGIHQTDSLKLETPSLAISFSCIGVKDTIVGNSKVITNHNIYVKEPIFILFNWLNWVGTVLAL